MKQSLTPALICELVGTFALVFVGAGAAALGVGGLLGAAFAHGMVVVGFVYAYGHVSGTHINPVVTIGCWVAGAIGTGQALFYVVFQLFGGVLGAMTLRTVLGGAETGLGLTLPAQELAIGDASLTIGAGMAILIEAILTFFLVNAVLNAAVSGKAGSLAAVGIGMTLMACILMGAPLTGASFNPARSLGPAVATGQFQQLWIYFVGPTLGAVVAALLYRGLLEE